MQDLINQLQQPTFTYDDKGQAVAHAPPAIMMRAARELSKTIAIMSGLETANRQLGQYCEQLTKHNETLQKEIDDRRKADLTTKSVSDDRGGIEPLAHGPAPDAEGSDRDGKESSAN